MAPVTRSRSRGSNDSDGTTVAVPQPPVVPQQQPSRRRTRAAASQDDSSDRAAKRARVSPEAADSGSAPQQAASGMALRQRCTIKRRERLDPSHTAVVKKAPMVDAPLLEAAAILESVRKAAPPSDFSSGASAASGGNNARGSVASDDGTAVDLDGDAAMEEGEAAGVVVQLWEAYGLYTAQRKLSQQQQQQQQQQQRVVEDEPAVAMRRGGRARKETARAVASRAQRESKDLKAALVASMGSGSGSRKAVSHGVRKSTRRA